MKEALLPIGADALIIDIISRYRQTEALFKDLEAETGKCICCEGLFLSLGEAAKSFGFNLDMVLKNLHDAVQKE